MLVVEGYLILCENRYMCESEGGILIGVCTICCDDRIYFLGTFDIDLKPNVKLGSLVP